MKLFLDENLSPRHAADLRAEGYDAIAVWRPGFPGATDPEVLRFAVENGRVLVTYLGFRLFRVRRFPTSIGADPQSCAGGWRS